MYRKSALSKEYIDFWIIMEVNEQMISVEV